MRANVFPGSEYIYDAALTAIFFGALFLELLRLFGIVKTPLKDCHCDNAEYKKDLKANSLEGKIISRVHSYRNTMLQKAASFKEQASSRLFRSSSTISPALPSAEESVKKTSSTRAEVEAAAFP